MEVVSSTSTGPRGARRAGPSPPARAAARPRAPRRRRSRRARARDPRALAGDGDRADLEHAAVEPPRARPSGSAPTGGCRRPRSPSSCARRCATRSPRRPERRRGQSSRGGGRKTIRLSSETEAPPSAQDGLEALAAELARVERAAQLVDGRAVLLGDLVARDLEEDQVARTLGGGGHPHEDLAPLGADALGGEDDALARLQALGDGGVEQLARRVPRRSSSGDASLRAAPGPCRARTARSCPRARAAAKRSRSAGDAQTIDDEAAGRVAHAVGGPQDARADRDVARPRRAVPARAVGGPRPALVVGDLHAAGAFGRGHALHRAAWRRLGRSGRPVQTTANSTVAGVQVGPLEAHRDRPPGRRAAVGEAPDGRRGRAAARAPSSMTTASKRSPSRPARIAASTRSTTPRSTAPSRCAPAVIAAGRSGSAARTQSGTGVPAQAARQHSAT